MITHEHWEMKQAVELLDSCIKAQFGFFLSCIPGLNTYFNTSFSLGFEHTSSSLFNTMDLVTRLLLYPTQS